MEEEVFAASALDSIVFETPSNLQTIPTNAFWQCKGISAVLNQAGKEMVTTGKQPPHTTKYFYGTGKGLTSITIPASVDSIADRAFALCSRLQWIDVEEGNETYSSIDGVLFTDSCTTLYAYPPARGKVYTLPACVKRIDYFHRLTSDEITMVGEESASFYFPFNPFDELHCLSVNPPVVSSDLPLFGPWTNYVTQKLFVPQGCGWQYLINSKAYTEIEYSNGIPYSWTSYNWWTGQPSVWGGYDYYDNTVYIPYISESVWDVPLYSYNVFEE